MFCGKCGAQMVDDARFCPKCGAAVVSPAPTSAQTNSVLTPPQAPPMQGTPAQTAYTPAPPTGAPASAGAQTPSAGSPTPVYAGATPGVAAPNAGVSAKLRALPKWIYIVVAAVVVIAIVCFAVMGLRGSAHNSPEATVESAVNSISSLDFNAVIDLFPPEVIDAQLEESGMTREELLETLEESMTYSFSMLSSSDLEGLDVDNVEELVSATNLKITPTIVNVETCDYSDLNSIRESYVDMVDGASGDAITEAAEVTFDMNISASYNGQDYNETQEGMTWDVVKIGGSWYLWGM